MSRLDFHIAQKIAQRDCINFAAKELAATRGIIVEFGLGAGRSYSHLRERFPGREVFCFDRGVKAQVLARPPADHFYLGEFADTLADPAVHARFAGRVMLVHLDVGTGGPEDEYIPEFVVSRTYRWLQPGALVLSDQDVTLEPAWSLEAVETTSQVAHAELFHVYRHRPA